MKFVAVNRYYRPDTSATAQLLTDLAERLVVSGQKVVIVTSRLSYDVPKKLAKKEVIGGVEVRRVWTSSFGRSNLVGRAIDYGTFYLFAFWELLKLVGRDDVLIAKTDPPLISVPAAIVVKLKGAKLVNWCQDLFPEVAAALGMKWAAGNIGMALKTLRNWSLHQAAFNAVLHERMAERLKACGVPESKIRTLPNWADANIQPLAAEQNALRKEWGLEGKFVIGYSGNLGRAHMPRKIEELLLKTRELENLVWLFIGSGVGMERIKAAAIGASNVIFKPYLPRERLSEGLSVPDVHLISLDPACEGYVVPSKLYGVLAVRRLFLFLGAPDGAVAKCANQLGCGVLDSEGPQTWLPIVQDCISSCHKPNFHEGSPLLENTNKALTDWTEALVRIQRRTVWSGGS